MAAYNLFLREVTANEWTVEGGGTALEAIGKETLDPTNPSTAKSLKTAGAGKKAEAKLTLPAGLSTELTEGARVIALTVHISLKAGALGKRIKFGTVSPAVAVEPEVTTAQAWYTVALSKAQAEEQTKATLEALVLLAEHLTATGTFCYEIYVSLETEAGAGPKVQHMAASLTFAGALGRNTTLPLAAVLSFIGGLRRAVTRPLAAGLSFAGGIARGVTRPLTAGLSFAGSLRRNVTRSLVAALSFAGSYTASEVGHFVKRFEASISFQGVVGRNVRRPFPATLTFAGGLGRVVVRRLQATLTFAGSFLGKLTSLVTTRRQKARTRIVLTTGARPVVTNPRTRITAPGSNPTKAVIE